MAWVGRWRYFLVSLISRTFLYLGHFWALHTQKLICNLQGALQKAWVLQFLSFLCFFMSWVNLVKILNFSRAVNVIILDLACSI